MVYINIVLQYKIVVNAVLKQVLNMLTLTANFVADLILCIELKDGVIIYGADELDAGTCVFLTIDIVCKVAALDSGNPLFHKLGRIVDTSILLRAKTMTLRTVCIGHEVNEPVVVWLLES